MATTLSRTDTRTFILSEFAKKKKNCYKRETPLNLLIFCPRGSRYKANKIGPKTSPWGTPQLRYSGQGGATADRNRETQFINIKLRHDCLSLSSRIR